MVHHANGQRSGWKVSISDNGWLWAVMQILLFSQTKASDSPHCWHSELRTSQIETSHTWAKNTIADNSLHKYDINYFRLSVILAFHSVEKCYWDHRWHAAVPRSQPHLKRKRWAPLSSVAWLYKSCSAPKNKYGNRVESNYCTKASNPTGTHCLQTHTHTQTHFLACSNS